MISSDHHVKKMAVDEYYYTGKETQFKLIPLTHITVFQIVVLRSSFKNKDCDKRLNLDYGLYDGSVCDNFPKNS